VISMSRKRYTGLSNAAVPVQRYALQDVALFQPIPSRSAQNPHHAREGDVVLEECEAVFPRFSHFCFAWELACTWSRVNVEQLREDA
jgi:hypothetical protein